MKTHVSVLCEPLEIFLEDFRVHLAKCLRGSRLRWRRIFGGQAPTLLEAMPGTTVKPKIMLVIMRR